MTNYLANSNTWKDGSYEAAIILGRCSDENATERLKASICSIWGQENFTLKSDRTLVEGRSAANLSSASIDDLSLVYGIFHHPTFGQLPCCTQYVREEELSIGDDWLYLHIPIGGLREVVPGSNAWSIAGNNQKSETWRRPLEDSLANAGLILSKTIPFQITLIGYMISGMVDENELKGKLPLERFISYVLRNDGEYTYFPTNKWEL